MRILLWHVHGSWTTAFVQGPHRYLLPVLPDRGPDGLGRARTWEWPPSAVEVAPEEGATAPVDVVILQRPRELDGLAERWLGGRRPGRDLPAVYLEHSTPRALDGPRHPAADRGMTIVHVTHFNRLFWDSGAGPVRVIEHGVVDPGARYSGVLDRAAVVINEPGRRRWVAGADLLPDLEMGMPLDVFGMGTGRDLPQAELHDEIACRRAYVHPYRWTSLGLSLVEAMHLAMPVVALASTEAPDAIPPGAGVTSTRVDVLVDVLRRLRRDPAWAREMGARAREHALRRYGLGRFISDWDQLLEEVTA